MRILVTGGAGFIGGNFIRYMLQQYSEYHILNLDKLTYAGNLESLRDVESSDRYRFVRGDICDVSAVEECMATGIDAVVHFAAESHVDRSIIDSTDFVRTNVMGTQTLLDAARRNGIRRFLHVSTDEVYGSLGSTGYFSETTPLAPNSPYASSKAASDLMVRAAHVTHGMPCIITRCSNNYGPFQFPEKLIPLLITNAREGKPLPIYGDGLYVRDWIHVLDHCAALATVLHQGREGGVYNIGGRNEWPNIQIARKILRLTDRPESLLTYVKDRPGHDRRYAIDCSYIERELGWRPSVDFEAGLQQTVQWYLDHPEWVAQVKSGAYQGYYRAMYEERDKTLGGL
jgi:dTDP-glucose 4,6-dehydratase